VRIREVRRGDTKTTFAILFARYSPSDFSTLTELEQVCVWHVLMKEPVHTLLPSGQPMF
jgi:hypothetical protein